MNVNLTQLEKLTTKHFNREMYEGKPKGASAQVNSVVFLIAIL